MAIPYGNFFEYLKSAFKWRLFDPKGQTATLDTRYNYFHYNLSYKQIFFYARKLLPKFYVGEYPDTEEGNLQMARKVLEKLDLRQDQELENLFEGKTIQSPETVRTIEEAQIQSQQAVVEPSPTFTPIIPAARRNIPIRIIREEEPTSTQSTAAPESTVSTPASTDTTTASAPASTSPTLPSIPTFSTGISFGGEKEEKKKDEKRPWWRRRPSSSNFLDNFGWKQIKNLATKIGRPLLRLAGQAGRLAGRLALQAGRAALRLAAQTVGRLLWPLLQTLGRVILQGLLSLLAELSGLSLGAIFATILPWLIVAGVVIAILVALFFISQTASQEIQFPSTEPVLLDYTLPLRNPEVAPHDIKALIQESWPQAQIDKWQIIIDAAKANNWNPALLLTLWIKASGAQGKEGYLDPLGCDPDSKHPKDNLDLSLQCFFGKFGSYQQFPDFIKIYAEQNNYIRAGSSATYYNAGFLQDIRYWYSQMILEGELGAITAIAPSEAVGISGCPVTGIITNPYGYNLPDYPYKNIGCGSFENCHNGIDIDAAIGTDIKSPMKGFTIRGEDNIRGKYMEIHETTQVSESEMFVIFDHLSEYAAKFAVGDSNIVEKGEVVGKTGDTGESTGPHLHYKINKGSQPQNPFLYLQGSATINVDVLTTDATISKNNYAKIRHQPGSITNNWGTCNTSP